MGSNPVAACVVFRNARPSKNDYRHFNVKTVTGPDDFSSMEEIVFRRYRRLIDEKQSLPQLVIIDGGKGQLSSAIKSIGDSVPIYLDKNSISLKIIQQLRNEAHRFGINFHRNKRSSEMLESDLDRIKGIGLKTKEALLKHFGSVDKIRESSPEELKKTVGPAKAAILSEYFTPVSTWNIL